MEILLAREMGFCFGVRRAVEMMEEATQQGGPMVSLGSVVHNPRSSKARRASTLASSKVSEARRDHAHGVGESVPSRSAGAVVDTTCPIVTRSPAERSLP
jgi:4-hydroxy-3-methylbut-2-enyl diphosphate reductase